MKRSPLRRSTKRKEKAVDPDVLNDAIIRDGYRCIVCKEPIRAGDRPLLHHVLPKNRWPHLRDVADNVVTIHTVTWPFCHSNHESGARRIRRDELPLATVAMIEAEGPRAVAYMERTYPLAVTA